MNDADAKRAQLDAHLQKWNEAREAASKWAEEEVKLRRECCALAFPAPHEGVNNHALSNGYTLKMTHKFSYSLSKSADVVNKIKTKSEVVDETQKAIDELGERASTLCDRLFKWSPELVAAEYKLLGVDGVDAQIKRLIDNILVIEPSMPSLEIAPPPTGKGRGRR